MLREKSRLQSFRMIEYQLLSELTTLEVGGACRWFAQVHDQEEIEHACAWALDEKLPVLFLGDGSNLLFSDLGFSGLVLQNRMLGIHRSGNDVHVAGGENLGELIRWLNKQQLAGMERLYGIPGTVAGAVVGNAGAYGQQISDSLIQATIWTAGRVRVLPASQVQLRYRHSAFKERRDWFLLSCTLGLKSSPEDLQQISDEILLKRQGKYPTGLKCPGSFFKNIVSADLPKEVLASVPSDYIQFGKIPAGKLLEAVGAKGARFGEAQFANYHANLLINHGHATSTEILSLANQYAARVWNRFRIRLEPEIRIVDDEQWPYLQALEKKC